MKKLLLASTALAVLTSPALAAAPKLPANLYFSVGAGLTSTRDSDFSETGDSGTIGIKDTANVSGALGVYLTKNIRSEFEISYRKADLSDISITGIGSGPVDGNIKTTAYLLNGYYDFMPDRKFNPYLSLGIGAAHHSGTISGNGITVGASDTVLAYQAGLGVSYALTPRIALQAGYRYLGSDKPDFDGIKAKYNANEFNAGIRFNF